MTPSKKPKIAMATRYIDCPHCKKSIELSGMRPVNLIDSIIAFLKSEPEAIRTKDIYKRFPNYSQRSVHNALTYMKKFGFATNPVYGLWCVENDK